MTQFDENTDPVDESHHNSDDDHQHDEHHHADHEGSADVVVTEYAGLFHPAVLLILFAGLLVRRRTR